MCVCCVDEVCNYILKITSLPETNRLETPKKWGALETRLPSFWDKRPMFGGYVSFREGSWCLERSILELGVLLKSPYIAGSDLELPSGFDQHIFDHVYLYIHIYTLYTKTF